MNMNDQYAYEIEYDIAFVQYRKGIANYAIHANLFSIIFVIQTTLNDASAWVMDRR